MQVKPGPVATRSSVGPQTVLPFSMCLKGHGDSPVEWPLPLP